MLEKEKKTFFKTFKFNNSFEAKFYLYYFIFISFKTLCLG